MDLRIIRSKLDAIDSRLITLLAKRQSYMQEVARYKKANRLPINQTKREQDILKHKKVQARKLKLNAQLVEEVWRALFKDAKRIQRRKK